MGARVSDKTVGVIGAAKVVPRRTGRFCDRVSAGWAPSAPNDRISAQSGKTLVCAQVVGRLIRVTVAGVSVVGRLQPTRAVG